MLLAIPPWDSPLAAHCKVNADAALRMSAKLARAVLIWLPTRIGWMKHKARSDVRLR